MIWCYGLIAHINQSLLIHRIQPSVFIFSLSSPCLVLQLSFFFTLSLIKCVSFVLSLLFSDCNYSVSESFANGCRHLSIYRYFVHMQCVNSLAPLSL